MFRRGGMGTLSTLTAVGIGVGIGIAASRMMRNGGIQLADMMFQNKNQQWQQQHRNSGIEDL